MVGLINTTGRRRSAYAMSARGFWRDRRLLAGKGNVHWTYGQKTTDLIGPIHQALMHFLVDWVYRGIKLWLTEVSRAVDLLLHLAIQVSYVTMLVQ